MAKNEAPLSLPTTLSYTVDVCVVTSDPGSQLKVGPSDLVFFQSMTPGSKTTCTFVVLRRTNPE